MKLYICDVNKYSIDELLNSKYLKEEDKNNALKYKIEMDQKEHLISNYFKNKYIGEYRHNENGKPVSDNAFFNISHSYNIVVIGISDREIGVDVEIIRDVKEDFIKYISNEDEYKFINGDNNKFYQIWCSKESITKALGIGLIKDIKGIPGIPLEGNKKYLDKDFYSKMYLNDNYAISVTLFGNEDFEIEIIEEEINS